MISVKATYELSQYVEKRLGSHELNQQAYDELFKVRSRLNDILSDHYVKRNKKHYSK